MKKSENTTGEEENDLEDLTESENDLGEQAESKITASMLFESVIEDAIINSSPPTKVTLSTTRTRD